jgi:hypothetical protein
VSSAEPDKVYPQWPVSYLAPYGTVPYNDRRLLVEPEVGLLSIKFGPSSEHAKADINFCSVPRIGLWDGELQPYAAHSGIRVRGDGDRARGIYY